MYLAFPEKKSALSDAIKQARSAFETEKNINLIDGIIIHYYMQGVRNFSVWDWSTGDVDIAYEGFDDELHFRWERVLRQYQTEIGRYMKMDLTPEVGAFGYGLDSVQKAGMGHASLKYMVSALKHERLKKQFLQPFLKYGTVGLQHYRGPGADIRERTRQEVVPHWELECYPARLQNLSDQRGLFRVRMVPVQWLKQFPQLSLSSDEKMNVQSHPWGYSPNQHDLLDPDITSGFASPDTIFERDGDSLTESDSTKSLRKWVEMIEWYGYADDQQYINHYAVAIGDHIALSEAYTDKVVCPLQIARHTDIGRFYGRGFVGPLIGLNDQVEGMLARQFGIVMDQDEFGMLVIPQTAGLNEEDVKKRERRKVLLADPDPTVPNYQPYKIDPYNSGDTPGKIANLAIQLQDMEAGQSELFQGKAPGRIDSAAGAGFVYETGNVSLVAPSNDIADCWTSSYESILQAGRRELEEEDQSIMQLPIVDDNMIGITIDPNTGGMSLGTNPIPHPWEVNTTVRDRLPTSKQQMVEQAKELLYQGQMTPMEFRILNYRENLGLPIVNRGEWEAYRKSVYQKIVLFNDGITPRPVPLNTEADDPLVALMVVKHLMASIEFLFASADVRGVFEKWKIDLEVMAGMRMPEEMPYPEEAAGIAEEQGMMGVDGNQGMGMGGGMGGSPMAPQFAGGPQPGPQA
jgi:hypothetical protein